MDVQQGLHSFWSQFDVPAYEENCVPDDADIDKGYITYQKIIGEFDEVTALTGSIFVRSDSWSKADAILNRIHNTVKNGGQFIRLDNGKMWINSSTPFAQSLGESDKTIRRYILHVTAEYMTA